MFVEFEFFDLLKIDGVFLDTFGLDLEEQYYLLQLFPGHLKDCNHCCHYGPCYEHVHIP